MPPEYKGDIESLKEDSKKLQEAVDMENRMNNSLKTFFDNIKKFTKSEMNVRETSSIYGALMAIKR